MTRAFVDEAEAWRRRVIEDLKMGAQVDAMKLVGTLAVEEPNCALKMMRPLRRGEAVIFDLDGNIGVGGEERTLEGWLLLELSRPPDPRPAGRGLPRVPLRGTDPAGDRPVGSARASGDPLLRAVDGGGGRESGGVLQARLDDALRPAGRGAPGAARPVGDVAPLLQVAHSAGEARAAAGGSLGLRGQDRGLEGGPQRRPPTWPFKSSPSMPT